MHEVINPAQAFNYWLPAGLQSDSWVQSELQQSVDSKQMLLSDLFEWRTIIKFKNRGQDSQIAIYSNYLNPFLRPVKL